jgi:dethiobiotin synthase
LKQGLFITGTDTGVGKTVVSSLLSSALRAFGIPQGYFKPIQTGEESDTQTVAHLSGLSSSSFAQPSYQFVAPMAPYRAAQREGRSIELEVIVQHWASFEDRAWVVEGAGGLLVPLNSTQTTRDLICALQMKMLLVASSRLGTINHILLTIEAAQSAKIPVVGIVLVGEEDPGLDRLLIELTHLPVLAKVPHVEPLTPAWVQEQGPRYFSIQSPIVNEVLQMFG